VSSTLIKSCDGNYLFPLFQVAPIYRLRDSERELLNPGAIGLSFPSSRFVVTTAHVGKLRSFEGLFCVYLANNTNYVIARGAQKKLPRQTAVIDGREGVCQPAVDLSGEQLVASCVGRHSYQGHTRLASWQQAQWWYALLRSMRLFEIPSIQGHLVPMTCLD